MKYFVTEKQKKLPKWITKKGKFNDSIIVIKTQKLK